MNSSLRILGIIPARGGSKSIPLKNIVDICGLPLIAYTIKAAHQSAYLNDVIISTDSSEIAKVAKEHSGVVPFLRPSDISSDTSSSIDVVRHALKFMEEKTGSIYDACMLLQPTNPLRTSIQIDEAIELYSSRKVDSVVSIVNVGAMHPHRMYNLSSDGTLMPIFNKIENSMMPRQQLPPIYIRSGDIYLTNRRIIISGNDLIGKKSLGYVIEAERTVNIDSEADLVLARHLVNLRKCGDFAW